jgi:hypothetical protein
LLLRTFTVKTVKQACELAPNALSIDVSDQIEQLDELIHAEGTGESFFQKTFITAGMRELLGGTIERLAGKSSNAIFHLKQAMGGGKTHLIVGTGLVAKHPGLRQRHCADISAGALFDTARVVAFNGRNSPVHYFWGEVANQLGEPELFKTYWLQGPDAPDEAAWIALLKNEQPTLILLDEMPPYFQILGTKPLGTGTVADIATRAFANMLSAAGKLKNVCVVVSDLDAAYAEGGALIERALVDARRELGRQEKTITPVDLAGNEIYDILRKRLFLKLPDIAVVEDIAAKYGEALGEATRSKVISRGAEAQADEIVKTYPFHPRLKELVALFKENEQFKQTRGLMELVSRLLKSVWEGDEDVYLIGAQHFDMGMPSVRGKLADISGMQDVISKDLWDANFAAHAQVIDASKGSKAASEVANLLFTASLSTAVNAVKGLTREEVLECLVTPLQSISEYNAAFDALLGECWFLHTNQENRYYYDRQENLTKMLQGLAASAPEVQISNLIKQRLESLFAADRKTVYSRVIALPALSEVVEEVKRNRVLLIIDPDSKMPPEVLEKFFQALVEKNNLLVLTGDKTQMASVDKSARKVYAALKADARIPTNHVQREEFEEKKDGAEQDFHATLLSIFDKVVYPAQVGDKAPELKFKALDTKRDMSKPFNGEEQIEKTLAAQPRKLFLDLDADFDALCDMAETLLWNDNSSTIDWATAVARERQKPKMPWMPPKGLETIKSMAIQKGKWEDLGTGHVSRSPSKKKTSVQVLPESSPDDEGYVRLRLNAIHAGPSGRIHYEEDGAVSTSSPILQDDTLTTKAYRVQFLAVDPNGQFDTGTAVTWENQLKIRAMLTDGATRAVALQVSPAGSLCYSLDGSEPRNGVSYACPIEIGNAAVKLLVFAEGGGLEQKDRFEYPAVGGTTLTQVHVDKVAPAVLNGLKRLGSRQSVFQAVDFFKARGAQVEKIQVIAGTNPAVAQFGLGEVQADAGQLKGLLTQIAGLLDAEAPVAMSVSRIHFGSGQDLLDFCSAHDFPVIASEVQQ